jgi:hypothetical protein
MHGKVEWLLWIAHELMGHLSLSPLPSQVSPFHLPLYPGPQRNGLAG